MPVPRSLYVDAEKVLHPHGRGLKGIKGEISHNKLDYGAAGLAGVAIAPGAIKQNKQRRSTHQGIDYK